MEQSQALSQNLSQHLAMTMKMQQAIKILALPAQELRGLIEKEYLENPALLETPPEQIPVDEG